jgi:UPF0755 protein
MGLEWRAALDRPLALPGAGLTYVVAAGQGVGDVARDLHGRGVLPAPYWLEWSARLGGEAARLKAGEYFLPAGTTPRGLLKTLVAGRVVQHSLTLVEGWTFAQVLEAVRRHDAIRETLTGLSPEAVMDRIGSPGVHPEGRFLPETYFFPRGTTDIEVLRRAYRDMATFLARAWQGRDARVRLKTPDEALVLASIIEKETAQPAERPRVAGVLLRRLQRGMLLQVDPTVIYGLGEQYDGNLRRQDLARDTPYNTYLRAGLPPTPIAMPGGASIQAALNPEEGGELFYVARGDGSHQFSVSLEEHQRAVAHYQLRRSPDRVESRSSGAGP